jgi:hypothetical protein
MPTKEEIQGMVGAPLERNAKSLATGDGTTDDAAALNTLFNTATERNIVFGKGTYKVNTQVITTTAGARLRITCDPNAKILTNSAFAVATNGIIRIENAAYLEIDGLNFEGNAATTALSKSPTSNANYGIYILNCDVVKIVNCSFTNIVRAALRIEGCDDVWIDRNYVPGTLNYAFDIWSCNRVICTRNIVSGNGLAQSPNALTDDIGQTPGIMFVQCTKVICAMNQITNFRNTATKADGCTTVLYLKNTVSEFGKDGIKVMSYNPSAGVVGNPIGSRCIIAQNTIENFRGWESDGAANINVFECEDVQVVNNTINGGQTMLNSPYENGIFIVNGTGTLVTKRVIVDGNIISACGGPAIQMARVSNTSIRKNKITNYMTRLTASYLGGINIDNSSHLEILDNILFNETAPVQDAMGIRTTICTNVRIKRNKVQLYDYHGIYVQVKQGTSEYLDISDNTINEGENTPMVITGDTVMGTVRVCNIDGNTIINDTLGGDLVEFNMNFITFNLLTMRNHSSIALTSATNALRMHRTGTGGVDKMDMTGFNWAGTATPPLFTYRPTEVFNGVMGRVVLPANVTNNNGTANTIADVTGLSFPVKAGVKYYFRFQIFYTAAATTTGSRWSINGPGITTLHYRSDYTLTTVSRTPNESLTGYNLPAASNATSGTTGSNDAVIEGIIQPSADGTLIARFASEVASSAIVALAGISFVEYKIIT